MVKYYYEVNTAGEISKYLLLGAESLLDGEGEEPSLLTLKNTETEHIFKCHRSHVSEYRFNMEPITLEFLKQLGKKIDTKFIAGNTEQDLYALLNDYHDEWTMIRNPAIICDKYVALLVRPRDDNKPDRPDFE